MREIKFRVWDKKINRMKNDIYVDEYYGGVNELLNQDDYIKEKYIIMQYTGLKDKNGKEIFEGDILNNTQPFYKGQNTIHIVKWNEYRYKGIERYNICEIIGNIYENPELLKREGEDEKNN